jgi:MFS family permease
MDERPFPGAEPVPGQCATGTAAGPGLRRARWATACCFGLTGLTFSTWAARIPARQADLQLSDGQLALAFVGLNAGAVLGLQLGALVVTRLGSRRALAAALPTFGMMLLPLAWAPNLATLTGGLAVSAIANSVVDIAINDQGVALQRHYGRSLLSGLHALHSLGGVGGGVIAAVVTRSGWPVSTHFALVAGIVICLSLAAATALLPPSDTHQRPTSQPALISGWTRRLLLLGALAFVFTLAEGSALDWAAVLLRSGRHATAATAAAALAVFQVAVTIGRLAGDRLIDRAGAARVFRVGASIAGLGFAAGLLADTAAGALAGLALLGLGLATLLPITLTAAGRTEGTPVPLAVARVSTLGYLGSFTGPLVIGGLAGPLGLGPALLLPAAAVAGTALASRRVAETP